MVYRSGNGRTDAMEQFVVRSFLLIVLLDEFEQFRDIEGTGRGYFRFRPFRHHIGNDGMKRIRVVQQYCVFSFHVYSANFLMRSSASYTLTPRIARPSVSFAPFNTPCISRREIPKVPSSFVQNGFTVFPVKS